LAQAHRARECSNGGFHASEPVDRIRDLQMQPRNGVEK
jgi:hypothetical protein